MTYWEYSLWCLKYTFYVAILQANWGDWYLPDEVCDFYLAMDVICSTSSIFNLVAISCDRFFAVTSPIRYSQHRHNPTPAYAVILICWSTSLAIGLPIMFGLNHRPTDDIGAIEVTTYDLPFAKDNHGYLFRFLNLHLKILPLPTPQCHYLNPQNLQFVLFTTQTLSSGLPWDLSTSLALS